ncbi:MAG: PRC-barrel domain-containing protein [Actinomycetota bacterium]
MSTSALVPSYVDRQLVTEAGVSIGKVRDVLLRPSNLRPEWLVVKTGWRKGEHLVPVVAVSEDGDELVVPYSKDRVDASPRSKERIAPRGAQAQATYDHYGIDMPSDNAI